MKFPLGVFDSAQVKCSVTMNFDISGFFSPLLSQVDLLKKDKVIFIFLTHVSHVFTNTFHGEGSV